MRVIGHWAVCTVLGAIGGAYVGAMYGLFTTILVTESE